MDQRQEEILKEDGGWGSEIRRKIIAEQTSVLHI